MNFFSSIARRSAPIKKVAQKTYSTIIKQASTRPLTTFTILLTCLLALIFLSSFITKPKKATESPETPTKEVATYNIGSAPMLQLHAQVQKSGVIQIVAQAPGIVSKINVTEGKTVSRDTNLISLGANYQGASAASVQRQLASVQYQNTKNTFDIQKDLIAKQRDLAGKQDESADQIRDITSKSTDDTRNLISLNENILSTIDANLKTLEDNNAGGANDALILQTKQLKSQLLAGNNQAKSSLRQAEFTQDTSKTPAQISDLSRDIAQKQLDLQEKSLKLALDTAGLQLKLAQINESTMFPTSPFAGTIQRVHVKIGQTVSPGTPLVTLAGATNNLTAVALVPQNIAKGITKLQSSYLLIGDDKIEESPTYISKEATNGQLYSVIFNIPPEYATKLTDASFIDIRVPIGYDYASAAVPFVPLDALHQTQDEAIVFTIEDNKALGKKVALGEVQGNYVEVKSGLSENDVVIVDRNVVAGDKVKAKSPQI